jgi:hypothetical protein
MGQNQPLNLSEEGRKELAIGLLREWWVTTTQALADDAGTEDAVRFLKPYFLHSGRAAARVAVDMLGSSPPDAVIAAYMAGYAIAPGLGAEFSPLYEADDGSAIGVMNNCATKGVSRELCIVYCSFSANSSVQELFPNYELTLMRTMANGDPDCQYLIAKKGRKAKVSPTDDCKIPQEQVFRNPLDEEKKMFFGLAYSGEDWVMATRAFVDFGGSHLALKSLRPRMRESGLSLGNRFPDLLDVDKEGIRPIENSVVFVQELHQIRGTCKDYEDAIEGEVEACPFATSGLPEICLQYEAFFNGVCEAIDPSYEFVYDRMMTKGDKTCHWTIRKKGGPSKEKPKEENISGDPVKLLTMMYVKGEITKDEYEEKMAIIEKHYLR